jgi:Cu+-exporting ATPase
VITSLLKITGMTCNRCVNHVSEALRAVPGVVAVEVSLVEQRAKIVHDPQLSEPPILLAAVEGAGYSASDPDAPEPADPLA